ncbi:alpha-galactosidase [Paenibacillus sp. Marseille-P2973]|uniref:alpha-galactosidase n=1 Tax=Paenibacillus sp. Marseille-P2973 TaxID=1871032 RepID=UPI001B368057|nr:alpha-galactosidase [Paenibacillus sp. Marseille-P2973]MBQ4898859.1 alpha-galactosidase [Paenibacillus sp. Marseille-P2973]
MPIFFDKAQNLFHLQSQNSSYIIQLVRGYAAHVYYGRKLRQDSNLKGMLSFNERASFSPNPIPDDKSISLDTLPQEYPQYGSSDFRSPAYQVKLANGTRVTELAYRTHRILQGKPDLKGLPAVYTEHESEAETLELELSDAVSGLTVILSYTVFADSAAITRSARIVNESGAPLELERALSASLDFADSDYDALYLSGAWARERHVQRRRLAPGVTGIGSRRGSSSHQQNPFFALLRPDANERQGEVYGVSLVYSGNFIAEAEVEQFGMTRLQIGLNPFDFSWHLEPGESFQTPEAVLVYSNEGLGGMSREYHRLYRTRLCRGQHRDRERPILVNNWEATYFDFNADKIEAIAQAGSKLGIELFVLDDGWFGRRDRDNSSLGDWFEDRRKLPGGLKDLANRVKATGLQFGLWFEPEMVSPDSDLYRSQPDWCLHVPDRRRTEAREQLVLDMSRSDVREYLYERLSDIFSTVPVTYVKWDMNRNMTEIGSSEIPADRQKEIAHRYILGLYELLERLTGEFPHILFESCSGGGGRFDPGMLYYMPQTWTSDDTDAVERLKIQYGTSLVYPVSTMGAHVSAVPNHQVERTTSLTFRGDVAMSGNFGYELDLTKFTAEEQETAKQQIETYKEIRGLVQQGEMYRLLSPFEGNETSWMFVSRDRNEALLFYFKVLAEPNAPLRNVKLEGLDPEKNYCLEASGEIYGGDRLMALGLPVSSLRGDFASMWVRLKAV